MIWDVIIIGGGASGLFAACQFKNKKILLLEKNSEVGKKLNITGSGQCNLTHGGKIYTFKEHYNNWNYIKDTLKNFDNIKVRDFFAAKSIKTFENEYGKVFPLSLKAKDITTTLIKSFVESGGQLNLNEPVTGIKENVSFEVTTSRATYEAKHVIVATGGLTYPSTGSTGDGYKFAKQVNIDVVRPRFALAQVYADKKMTSLSGMSFEATIENNNISYKGDLLITHHGFSGPVILNNSRNFRKNDVLHLNFVNQPIAEFSEQLLKIMHNESRKSIKQVLYSLTKKRLVDFMLEELMINPLTTVSELSKKNRKLIEKYLCSYRLMIQKVGKEHLAMITAGGINVNALKKKTYEAKDHDNLYFIGECVDIDGDTGGYNLQFAFSSGFAACKDINRKLAKDE